MTLGDATRETLSHYLTDIRQLPNESPKARENGELYALLTAQNAAAALERRQRSQGP